MAGMYSEKCILRQNHCTSTIGGSQSFVASGHYPDMWCWCNKAYCFTISFSEYFYIVGVQSKTKRGHKYTKHQVIYHEVICTVQLYVLYIVLCLAGWWAHVSQRHYLYWLYYTVMLQWQCTWLVGMLEICHNLMGLPWYVSPITETLSTTWLYLREKWYIDV